MKNIKDHLGISHKSIKAMCVAWGQNYARYQYRIKNGWTIEKALTEKEQKQTGKAIDHLGNSYKNIDEMCKAWNTNKNAFYNKKHEGKTLKQCLEKATGKKIAFGNQCMDIFGNSFNSIKDMYNYYKVPENNYYSLIRNGNPQSVALGIIPTITMYGPHMKRHFWFRENFYIGIFLYKGIDGNDYWSCNINGQGMILSKKEIYQRMEEIVIEEYKSTGTVQTAES